MTDNTESAQHQAHELPARNCAWCSVPRLRAALSEEQDQQLISRDTFVLGRPKTSRWRDRLKSRIAEVEAMT